jgi:hypothetical protein
MAAPIHDADVSPNQPGHDPINPILLRMRDKFLDLLIASVDLLRDPEEYEYKIDDLDSYVISLRSAGLTESELTWVTYVPHDVLPGFDPTS